MAKRSGDLDKYNQKRDPAKTNEPFAPEPLSSLKGKTLAGAFVVHLHDATRTHYDVRLEIGGSLKSFAVPRGPSLDPADKRMAIHTEDHPLEYLDFEAVIPEGNYGAGPMIVWDRGTVQYLEGSAEEGIARNKIDFALSGYKLRGRFGLIKTSGRKKYEKEKEGAQEQWLLVKKTDVHAKPGVDITVTEPRSVLSGMRIDELPSAGELAATLERAVADAGATPRRLSSRGLVPMLCATTGAELNQPGWLYELKLDGVRILGERSGEDATLTYRTGRTASASYPEITRALRALAPTRLILDGEIVAFDERGRPNFQRLGSRIHATRAYDVKLAARSTPVVYLVFDLLALGDHDLRALPLLERKRLLAQVIRGKGLIRMLDHIPDDGRPLYELCRAQDMEGVVAKRADSTYVHGPTRTGDWVKIKLERTEDFVVFGFTRGEGARDGMGALDLASYDGDVLRVRGRVGSGLDEASIALLKKTLSSPLDAPLAEGEMLPAPNRQTSGGQTFVKPEVVVSVRYAQWTDEGRLRHPVFLGVRADLDPRECTAAPDEEVEARAIALAEAKQAQPLTAVPGSRVTLSNQDKVFWPDEGYTKGDLCNYYLSVAPYLLPYLKDRPVLMVRYPDGITGKSFYQWNVPQGVPDWVHTFPIRSEDQDGRDVISFRVEDEETLLYIANLGCIPVHVLASRFSRLEFLDFLTIDFDIGDQPFKLAIELARSLHTLLDELGLKGFPKTSGQSGLHVLVPLGGVPYATAKMLAELLGRLLHLKHPDISTMERMRDKRPNAVYIDTGQTGRARSIVAPLSVRAVPGARVSTPLAWDEVGFALDPRHFTMFTVVERLERYGDPMASILQEKPDIAAVIHKLEKRLK